MDRRVRSAERNGRRAIVMKDGQQSAYDGRSLTRGRGGGDARAEAEALQFPGVQYLDDFE